MYINNIKELKEKFFIESNKQLNFLAFGTQTKNSKKKIYTEYRIRKRNGTNRILREPTKLLKIIQFKILNNILNKYWYSDNVNVNIKDSVTGFIKGKSIVYNAMPHIGKDLVIKIDIKDFFSSISKDRVFGIFKLLGYNDTLSTILSGFCTYKNELPQGAPTSPMISNLICLELDYKIISLIKNFNKKDNYNINYTRYADDLSFSMNNFNNDLINEFLISIIDIVTKESFIINYSKLGIYNNKLKQNITGIVVNKKMSVGRDKFRLLKAIFYNIEHKGWIHELKNRNMKNKKNLTLNQFKNTIHGLYSYFIMVNVEYKDKLKYGDSIFKNFSI